VPVKIVSIILLLLPALATAVSGDAIGMDSRALLPVKTNLRLLNSPIISTRIPKFNSVQAVSLPLPAPGKISLDDSLSSEVLRRRSLKASV